MDAFRSPRLAVSIGCPCGIGPEVSLVGAVQVRSLGVHCCLVGDIEALRSAALVRGLDPQLLEEVADPASAFDLPDRVGVWCPVPALEAADRVPGRPTAGAGRAQLAWINEAARLVSSRTADAIVTGPVSKEVIARSGAPGAERFIGHTEHLAELMGEAAPTMVFVSGAIAVALVTTHLAIADVPRAITCEAVATTCERVARIVARLAPRGVRIAVASLNPHAGEGGLFGQEEREAIVPGIAVAKERMNQQQLSVELVGPIGAETAFRKAFAGDYDAVVAMYHDQATIPLKVRCFGDAVNVTAGLRIVRTSVDHGTGYDIAGQGKADAGSMVEAMRLAVRLTS